MTGACYVEVATWWTRLIDLGHILLAGGFGCGLMDDMAEAERRMGRRVEIGSSE